ncbi:haloalkane dehalogenase [Actinokineospora fastidiosa]|uniref:Haloalkane dehalogenase n=1 Tax=Actinokineospora fastidiosa TaxID=1816 RepID=A0A918LHG9_9PSEU|nr:haloalkane dehalogenase [Actinokineospora fastidiosa]
MSVPTASLLCVIEHVRIATPAGTFDGIAAGAPDDRPVLLLHGFPEAASAWEHQVAALGRAGYRAVAVDQRGYSPGVRPESPGEYHVDDLVGDVLAIADASGWARFDLVGHDVGAVVGWHAAAAHPDRVRTLAALSAPHPCALAEAARADEDQALRSQHLALFKERSAERRLLADDAAALRAIFEHRLPRSAVADYVARLSEPDALTAALNWFRAARRLVLPDRVSVPVLYLWGTEDVAVGSTAALSCGKWVDGPYHFEMLDEASHWVVWDAPEAVTSLLIAHVT